MFFYNGSLPCELRTVLDIKDGIARRHNVWLEELTECIQELTTNQRAEMPFAKFVTGAKITIQRAQAALLSVTS
jgi:hypothetical protein